jgi:hypothetical protein
MNLGLNSFWLWSACINLFSDMRTGNCSQFQYSFQLQYSSGYKKLKEQNDKISTVIVASPLVKIIRFI